MTEAGINTAQADGPDLAQGAGFSHYDNTTSGSNHRKQLRNLSDSGRRAFVPTSGLRSGVADVKAVAARQDREDHQGQNGSQGDRHASTEKSSDEQTVDTPKAPTGNPSDPLQQTSNAVTDREGDIAEKIALIKAQVADLLERIESSRPGFAETVMPKVETEAMAIGPMAKSQTVDQQALLTSLGELAGLLEELLDLLKDNNTDVGGNTQTAMANIPPGYAPASNQPEPQGAVEMFMSIYDQMSDDTRREVVEILAPMAFEQQETDDVPATTNAPPPSADDNVVTGDDNAVTGDEATVGALRGNPGLLSQAGIQGMEVTGMELFSDPDGLLSEASKIEVNKLIGYLSDLLGGIEVVANVYVDGDENLGVHLTAGEEDSTIFYPMEGTIYSTHVHTNGSWVPSIMDRENEIPGAEDAIVVGDGVPGNETGSYFHYA